MFYNLGRSLKGGDGEGTIIEGSDERQQRLFESLSSLFVLEEVFFLLVSALGTPGPCHG